jgi:hypothetical protein
MPIQVFVSCDVVNVLAKLKTLSYQPPNRMLVLNPQLEVLPPRLQCVLPVDEHSAFTNRYFSIRG